MTGKKLTFALCPFFLLFLTSCSTAPKNPGEIYSMRRQAENLLETGNKQTDRGDFISAAISLEGALKLASATDDPSLRLRSKLSYGNLLFFIDQKEKAQSYWAQALEESKQIGNTELAAVCRIHAARGKLMMSNDKNMIKTLKDQINNDLLFIKSDKQYIAFAWTVIAQAERDIGNYTDGEKAAKKSLAIYEKEKNFELAAYSWYIVASCSSLSGDLKGAVQALNKAIELDRRVENSWGLASNWRALGDVYKKSGQPEDSRAAYLRAAEIFRAADNNEAADEALSRIKQF